MAHFERKADTPRPEQQPDRELSNDQWFARYDTRPSNNLPEFIDPRLLYRSEHRSVAAPDTPPASALPREIPASARGTSEQRRFAAPNVPSDLPREIPASARGTKEPFRHLSRQDRAQLPREDRLSATTDQQGRKTGPYVDVKGYIRDRDKKRDELARARATTAELRDYFNGWHKLEIPSSRTRDGKKEDIRSIGKVLQEASRQATEQGRDLSYLTQNREKAMTKAATYARARLRDGYISDGK